MKKYIFILCPPYQGSTILVNLLDSSNNVSTFLNAPTWAGESQWLIKNHGDKIYESKRWDPNYNINMDIIKKLFDIYLDQNKTIFVEKSPPNICRAKKIQDYFSTLGEVYFIISIRNPYSVKYDAEQWVSYAQYQKTNIETLTNTIVTSYEETCTNLDNLISKIKDKIPECSDIYNRDNPLLKNERGKKIHTEKVNIIVNKEEKNRVLTNHIDLLNFFGYSIVQ
jgi:hypothetical protein